MKTLLIGQYCYGRLHDYVLKLSREWLLRRLVSGGEGRPQRVGSGAVPYRAANATRCVLVGRPPPVPKRTPVPQVAPVPAPRAPSAWAVTLRQQVKWVTRRLVGSLITPGAPRLLLRNCKELTRRLIFSGGTRTLVAFVGITLTGDDGLITKADRMEVLCADIKSFVQDMSWQEDGTAFSDIRGDQKIESLDDLEISEEVAKGCNAVVYKARIKDRGEGRWNLAVKMMFNYDAESNACAILRAMYREVVPAPRGSVSEDVRRLVGGFGLRLADLPPHRNLVQIRDVFVDRVPLVGGALSSYPAALPPRLNPDGAGRNASLFLVMNLYDENLHGYLSRGDVTGHTRLLLLAQLLEGVSHLNRHHVAHRDLKSDNLLIGVQGDGQQPRLVLADFGCCLAETSGSMSVPFTSWDVDRGGNLALMPPEISAGRPGRFATLDFSQADVWAAGSIAYEILGGQNPFYGRDRLNSGTYAEEELPPLPAEVPPLIARLVADMLRRRPTERLTAVVAATICQLFLWAPKTWFYRMPTHKQIKEWLLTLTAKVMCEWRARVARDDRLEHVLVHTFLCRLTFAQLHRALLWIHGHR